jgi:hypothetical protein
VTRHGLHHTRTPATAARPMAQLVHDVINCDPMVAFDYHSTTTSRCRVQQCRSEPLHQIRWGGGRTLSRIG